MTPTGISRATCGLFLLLHLSNCTTVAQTNPPRTATEEMLLSTASDRAAEKLALAIPKEKKVFVENGNFEGTDAKYAIASIKSHLLQKNIALVDDKKTADIIIETRAGALSTDRDSLLIGIPSFNIPVPFASAPLPFPQLALYDKEEQNGVAKFAITGYDVKAGTLVDAQDPQYGFTHNTKKTVFFFISWTNSDYMPEAAMKELKSEKKQNEAPARERNPHLEYNSGISADAAASSAAVSAPAPASATPPTLIR